MNDAWSTPGDITLGRGTTSHQADVAAAYRWVVDPAGEGVPSSHHADVLAGYDDSSRIVHDGTGLHR